MKPSNQVTKEQETETPSNYKTKKPRNNNQETDEPIALFQVRGYAWHDLFPKHVTNLDFRILWFTFVIKTNEMSFEGGDTLAFKLF